MQKVIQLFLLLLSINMNAQFNSLDVFLGNNGQPLLDSLVRTYKPQVILDYDHARDTMFAKIYKLQDSVACVYTGHKLYLSPTQDPSTAMYSNGSGNGINTEHTYPQSKGASVGNARSNLHHLFPARTAANSARNNFPYANVNENRVNAWYYKDLSESTPTFDKNLYSKLDISIPAFEPRDEHKGNAARAIFYFYTMYKAEADAADPQFFAKQITSICQWHLDDPVDSLEWSRNYLIASYQEGKVNPFILDCTLPYRTFCPYLPNNSCYTGVSTLADLGVGEVSCFPNPANQDLTFRYELNEPTNVTLQIYTSTGQLLLTLTNAEMSAGTQEFQLDCGTFSNGFYSYQLVFEQKKGLLSLANTFLIVH